MKKVFFFLFFFISTISFAEDIKKVVLLAKVNNIGISNFDVVEEIEIIKILSNNFTQIDQNISKIAMQNLIEDALKKQEIEESNIAIESSDYTKNFETLILNIQKANILITDNLKNKIFKKIKLNSEWNQLINQKYRWNVNVNINEIEDRLKDTKNIPTDGKELQELKNKLINIEKNKKLEVFSKIHLSKIKKQSLIKFF
jgi:hypothetical protein